jgi:uncharacterized cupin superfamily protein
MQTEGKPVTPKAFTLLFAAFLLAAPAAGQNARQIIRFEPHGPIGIGLEGDDSERSHVYYRSADNRRVSAGVWEAAPHTSELHEALYSEFMYLLGGSVTLIDGAGREETFGAGDALLVPRGTRYTWKQTERLRKYWVIFDVASEAGADPMCAEPTFIRLDPNGPVETGLTSRGRTMSHRYYAGQDGSSVGVWETAPHTAPEFHETEYSELMVFLSGTVRLAQPDGAEQTFHAGDVALVPRGAFYQWKSGTARKFWVILDSGSTTPCGGGDNT